MFVDKVKIFIQSGNGGNGAIAFRREKYVANGGPNGGDGGKGGDIIFKVNSGINTLSDFRHKKKYKSGNGEDGGQNRRHGRDGDNLIINVPPGTLIKEDETNLIIADMATVDDQKIIIKGGRGGKGNQHYATPTMQIPQFAQNGQRGKGIWITLELKVIADVGLVGFPNVGKSTFLSRVSNAKPKIANYHFTTISPNLGVVDTSFGRSFVIADIPGLIEGAHTGIGLGHEFLRHVERTKILLHVVDAAGVEGRDPIEDIEKINHELKSFNDQLLSKPQLIAANKIDVSQDNDNIEKLKEYFEPKDIKVFPISAVTGKGIKELMSEIIKILDTLKEDVTVYEQEYFIEGHQEKIDDKITITKLKGNIFDVEGEPLDKMLGYTNLDTEKGFAFFQKFLKEQGIIERLEKMGIAEGDTVKIYNLQFDYYK